MNKNKHMFLIVFAIILTILFGVLVDAGCTCKKPRPEGCGDWGDCKKDPIPPCQCTNSVCSCFAAGTPIIMADGTTKNIEDVTIGDMVLSYDVENKRQVSVEIGGTWEGPHDDMYIVNGEIHVTSEHPFWTEEVGWAAISPEQTLERHGWLPANLAEGYHFVDVNSNLVPVVSIKENFGTVKTYNLLDVGNYNTYYAAGVLVHNKGGGGGNPPPPPPPICGDGKWTASTDKACEYTANPIIYNNNGQYTGAVCQANGQSCRNDCTCCGDSIKQGDEKCDLGTDNGKDLNNDGYIGAGECRAACTFCGDGVKQAGEECDDGNTNNLDQCRNNCKVPFCGDGYLDAGEFCDFAIVCPSKGCDWENYNEWKDSGYFPGCRNDCTACGDGKLQVKYGETCDDTRAYEDQQHSAFGSQDYANTCPGGCQQPGFISGNYDDECTCIPEICDQHDNNANCRHCAQNKNTQPYYEQLCWSEPGNEDASLWQLDIDKNEDGVLCNCCVYGEPGCCDDPDDNSCLGANRIKGDLVCDDGVDEGFSWLYQLKNPTLSSAVASDINGFSSIQGEDVTAGMIECSDLNKIDKKYVYLTYNDLLDSIFSNPVENTEDLDMMSFEVTFRNLNQVLNVEWYDGDSWEFVCGPFVSAVKKTESCALPEGLKNKVWEKTLDQNKPILRLVIS